MVNVEQRKTNCVWQGTRARRVMKKSPARARRPRRQQIDSARTPFLFSRIAHYQLGLIKERAERSGSVKTRPSSPLVSLMPRMNQ